MSIQEVISYLNTLTDDDLSYEKRMRLLKTLVKVIEDTEVARRMADSLLHVNIIEDAERKQQNQLITGDSFNVFHLRQLSNTLQNIPV